MLKNKFYILLALCCSGFLASCNDDDLEAESIFPDTSEELDPYSSTYQLDKYCEDNYREVYNIQFRYKLQDVGTDMTYNLIPAEYDKSVDLAVLTKYLWFDVYDKVVPDKNFMKTYGPRILHLIGSPAVNPANGTIVLGLAEGGLKVSLFNVNTMDPSDFKNLNEFYFLTMHHEFAHILHQTKTYPTSFNDISTSYDPAGWQDRQEPVMASMGFVSPYASSEVREDFAETIAHWITETDEDWEQILDWASRGWKVVTDEATGVQTVVETEDNDGIDGRAVILQKVQIARDWFSDAWGIDIDALRAEVQERQLSINEEDPEHPGMTKLEYLRTLVYDIPAGDAAVTAGSSN